MSLEHAFFYKSVNGDRVYDDTSFEHWLKKFFTSGVFLNDLQVSANDDMTVTVGGGYVNIDGKVKVFTSESSLIIETAGASYPRIDSIVLERNDSERDILLKVVKGGYSSEPVAHTPVRQDGVYQLVIAQVLVNAGAVKVTQANITDTRSNTELCGIVAGAVDQIDFSQIQAQFDSYFAQYKTQIAADYTQYNEDMETYLDQMAEDFSAWFEGIRNQLDEDAAGHLQNQIDEINEKLEYAGGSMVFVNVDAGEYNTEGLEVNLEIDGRTYTETIFDNSVVFTGVLEVGTAKITCVDEAQEIDTETSINIPYYGAYETSITLNSGSSYKAWIEAGGLNPSSYESLDALLEDEAAVRTLMTKKEAVDVLANVKGDDLSTIINHRYVAKWVNYREYAYSTLSANAEIKALMDASGMYGMYITMKEPRALVPAMTSNTAPSGEVGCSSEYNSTSAAVYAFDNNTTTKWASTASDANPYVYYKFTKPTCVTSFDIVEYGSDGNAWNALKYRIEASNDNADWVPLGEFTEYGYGMQLNNNKKYLYYRFYTVTRGTNGSGLSHLQFYGYQEGDTLWEPKGLVPVMTSNTAPYGEVFTSGVQNTNYAHYLFDNNDSTFWAGNNTANGYAGYKFVNPTMVKKVKFATDCGVGYNIQLQCSNNNSEWINASDIHNMYDGGISKAIEFETYENLGYYLYWRINYTSSSPTTCNTRYIQFYGRQLEALIPPMTSNTAPIGEASASTEHSSPYMAYKAFTDEGMWNSAGGDTVNSWIQYKFESPTVVKAFFMRAILGSNYSEWLCFPKEFEFRASNDGEKWDILYSDTTSTPSAGSKYYYVFDNTKAYTHYRLLTKSIHDGVCVIINGLQFYGTPDYESRTYIYDHGVELGCESMTNANGWAHTGIIYEEPIYNSDNVKCVTTNTPAYYSAITTNNALNLSDYKLASAIVEGGVATASYHGALTVHSSKTGDSASTKVAQYDIPSPHTPTVYLDISSVMDSGYVCVFANNTRSLTLYALWLE